eukprot:582650-Amphidinium_carterae.1
MQTVHRFTFALWLAENFVQSQTKTLMGHQTRKPNSTATNFERHNLVQIFSTRRIIDYSFQIAVSSVGTIKHSPSQ